MKKIYIFLALLLIVIGLVFYQPFTRLLSSNKNITNSMSDGIAEKVYVALEGEGKIAVINPVEKKLVKTIDLTIKDQDSTIKLSPHNVQVSPDNKSVWVTANFVDESMDMDEQGLRIIQNAYAQSEGDYIIHIDPLTDTIIESTPLSKDNHLAHIVLTPDSKLAFATAQEKDVIYKLNTQSYSIEKTIQLPKGSKPHGLRSSVDGTKVYVAEMGGKALGILDVKTNQYKQIALNGAAVQTAVTQDNKYVFISVYDPKSIARYEIATGSITYAPLPNNAQGPVQIYATPDSKYLYIADQGYYFEKPRSNKVYKIDINTSKIVQEIIAGNAPHGVIISPDGKRVYITNLLSNDVSIIDATTDKKITRVNVGKMPNGVSYWQKP